MAETATTNTANAQATAESTATEHETNAAASAQMDEQTLLNNDRVKALIQSAVDREKNKVGNENKQLKKQLEALQKEKLTDDELKALELKEREKTLADRDKALADRDKALTDKENRWIAMQAIKEAGLDDGSKDSLQIVDFVMADDEDGIRERVKAFGALVERITAEKVKAEFKSHGRTPGVGSDTASNAGGQHESFAARLGKNTANANKAAQSVLDHYLGGK